MHVIASGIERVVYIEPYPKGYTQELYRDEIYLGRAAERIPGRVHFEPFIGISPFRFRDFFEKGRRKDNEGRAKEWHFGTPRPRLTIINESYPNDERLQLGRLIAALAEGRIEVPRRLRRVRPNQPRSVKWSRRSAR